jgi:hypothetical protein
MTSAGSIDRVMTDDLEACMVRKSVSFANKT